MNIQIKNRRIAIGISVIVLVLAVTLLIAAKLHNSEIVQKTYCSDICPGLDYEADYPFDVYVDVTSDECKKLNGTANYAYGWSNDYLGCTPEGYTTLEQATKNMWDEYHNK